MASLFEEEEIVCKSRPAYYPCPDEFRDLIPTWDHYLYHGTFRSEATRVCVVVTDRSVFKVNAGGPAANRVKHWEHSLLDVHSIERTSPVALRLFLRIPQQPSSTPSTEDYHARLRDELLTADSMQERDLFLMVVERCLRVLFQKNFENLYLPSPEIYQYHVFLSKLSTALKRQKRCLVASTTHLRSISVRDHSLDLNAVKWRIPYIAINQIQTHSTHPRNITLELFPNTSAGGFTGKTMRSAITFEFKDKNEVQAFIKEIQRLYQWNVQKKVTVKEHEYAPSTVSANKKDDKSGLLNTIKKGVQTITRSGQKK